METPEGYSVGSYRLGRRLSAQDAGAVFHALDTHTQNETVMRFFVPENPLPPAAQRRFSQSAAVLQGLSHSNLVAVCDHGIHRGVPYLVTPFIPGGTLRQNLHAPLPWGQAARLLAPVAKALAYLHDHRLYHANIHSQNIMMSKSLLVADAGMQQLAALVDPQAHTCPENHWQKDIHDLGIVFCEMVCGRIIEEGIEGLDIPGSLQADLPDQVRNVIARALGRGARPYANMAAFAEALARLGWGDEGRQPGRQGEMPRIDSNQVAAVSRPTRAGQTARSKKHPGWLRLALFGLLFAALILTAVHFIDRLPPTGSGDKSAVVPSAVAVVEETRQQPSTPQSAPPDTPVTENVAESELESGTEPEPSPAPSGGDIIRSAADGMELVYVPAGEFIMGSDDRDASESPAHSVYLDAYWIDRTEVTNGMYALCAAAGACSPPASESSSQHDSYYNDTAYVNYPVIFVTWQQAGEYCQWAGRRLPSEAEWEKAARGTDARICPWGSSSPSPERLNYASLVGDTTPVGSYPAGASPYGALDMAGNVWEWTADWFSSGYSLADLSNPTGPEEGARYVLRGGSWYYEHNYIRAAFRFSASGSTTLNDVGFRCALTAQD